MLSALARRCQDFTSSLWNSSYTNSTKLPKQSFENKSCSCLYLLHWIKVVELKCPACSLGSGRTANATNSWKYWSRAPPAMEASTVKMLFLYLRHWSSSKRTVHRYELCVHAGVHGRRRAGPVLQQHHCAVNSWSVNVVLAIAGSQRYLLTQTYGCHFSIWKRNKPKNALKLDFVSFSSFVCRNRRGKPFLSLSVLFQKHVPPSLSAPSVCCSVISPILSFCSLPCVVVLPTFLLPLYPCSLHIHPLC